MCAHFTESQILERLHPLSRRRLTAWVEARIVQPVQSESGPLYRELDLARLQTLCDLALELNEEEDRLDVMMRLIDRLHALTAEMDAVMKALAAEPDEVRARIRAVLTSR